MLVVAAMLLAQSPSADSSALIHAGRRAAPIMTAVRVQDAPTLDGRLDDPAWRQAQPVRGFIETDPDEGQAPDESTTVMIVYDDAAIYVGARLYDAEPSKITRRLGRRDDDTQSDVFYVDFDSYHDHRTGFEFAVNPAGVKLDDLCSNDFFIGDRSWDPVWDVATAVDSLGWVVEMRIPFSQLRFPQVRDQVWGVNFFRWVFRKNQFSQWSFKPKTETGYASRFGHLVGLHDIPAPKRLELLPYTLGRGTYDNPTTGNPFDNGHTYFGGAGLDVKYGVTSNLTLDAAVNPDFGQVESDPAFVNLTTVEQFLQERRPFFVEGASIFAFGGTGPYIQFGNTPQYFYSRRIGRVPELEPGAPSNGFVDLPSQTTILGATKLTGKTPSGWSVGVLDAVTAREQATFDSSTVRWHEDVEPFTNYVVGRVRREVGGHTGFGLLATAVNRRNGSASLDSLRSGAYSGAADFYHRWANNAYSLYASVGVTYVTGDALALRLTQESSTRYYQRPDAPYLRERYDTTRTSLSGLGATMPEQWSAGGTITSDTRQPVNGTLNAQYFRDAAGSWSLTVSPLITIRPSAAVSLQLGPSYVKGFSAAQFVTSHSSAAPSCLATYQACYIFGELSQRQLDLTTRLNLTFTPTVSFQLYVQPFTFSGRYTNFKELRAPRTYSFAVYGQGTNAPIAYDSGTAIYTVHAAPDTIQFANPDSRVRSLRSNAVLRWEYRPGSTLFVVWSQSRFANLLNPALDLGQYVAHEMFLDPPTNVLLVKVNYWLSL